MVNKSKFVFNEEDNIPPPKASSKVAAQSRLCRKYDGQLTYDTSNSDSNIVLDSLNYKNSTRCKPFQETPSVEVPLKTSYEQRCINNEELGDPVLDDVVAKLKNLAVGKKQVSRSDFKAEKIPSSRVYNDEVGEIVAKLKREAMMLNQASERSNDVLSVEKSHPGNNVNSNHKVECFPCVCDRPLKLILCIDCGITFPGRIRKKCPMHMSVVFLLDVDDCKGCNKKSLREYDLPEGMEMEVKNVKVKM